MTFFKIFPYLEVFFSVVVLIIAAIFTPSQIKGWRNIFFDPIAVVFFLIFLILVVLAPLKLKEGFDTISKRNNATRHLDGYSLSILANMSGLMFAEEPGKQIDLTKTIALRHLISLELIELDAFPSSDVSWGYYLTDLGRHILTDKLKRKAKLYPESFYDFIRSCYWKAYPEEFVQRKNKFSRKYKVSWDNCWEAFDWLVRKENPNSNQYALTIFETYLNTKPTPPIDVVKEKIVNPWLEKTGLRRE